jgi:hypothetical protein
MAANQSAPASPSGAANRASRLLQLVITTNHREAALPCQREDSRNSAHSATPLNIRPIVGRARFDFAGIQLAMLLIWESFDYGMRSEMEFSRRSFFRLLAGAAPIAFSVPTEADEMAFTGTAYPPGLTYPVFSQADVGRALKFGDSGKQNRVVAAGQ